jgi:hypothetical protein
MHPPGDSRRPRPLFASEAPDAGDETPPLRPGPVEVLTTEDGKPRALVHPGGTILRVASIGARWRIEDLRFNRPRVHVYFAAVLERGDLVTFRHNRTEDRWEIYRAG